ncbi:cytidine deaminase [Nocardioides daphniae]|uniref:Cytidine deaminase n=1 Tax=Nocardioides daphniae TaxID=402297 RepID=A0A4P7UBU1_9ACTN|nr:cytidine deaminase [Nocardioides daphniae]QCC77652.1 cytidine deaminase [Nocardioides daphniae]GGD29792.1 cytidine deaminase [Nocardioides daphniae]
MTEQQLSAEDAKLVTLARATRARVGAAEGAAVRDRDGRTYAAASVDLPSLQLGAVQVCVAMAIASGSTGLEAVVRLSDGAGLTDAEAAVVRDFAGAGVQVHLGDPRGTLTWSGTN